MLLKRERSEPETPRSTSLEEQPTPPDSPERIPTPPYLLRLQRALIVRLVLRLGWWRVLEGVEVSSVC